MEREWKVQVKEKKREDSELEGSSTEGNQWKWSCISEITKMREI